MLVTPEPPRDEPPPIGLREAIRVRFDLTADQADAATIDQSIRAGVPFRGTNLWLLIFAILIASVGLNVNSTAVIIGAMLISPLMGPIMGAGYGAAVADFRLFRLALSNLLVATLVSLGASTIYFLATPLSEAHSELLARTSPSIWDVLIALFGGLAGIVGSTRREKSNVVPGVAIATALMPPLCTAGYGIATANLAYFAGAFYLFLINSVFISAATFVMVRVMRLPEVSHVDAAASTRAHRWIAAFVLGTALPSLFLAQRLVAAEVFGAHAATFLAAAFPADRGTFVVGRELDSERREIRVTVLGDAISAERRDALSAMLPAYSLEGVTLSIAQNEQQQLDVAALRADLARDLYQRTLDELRERDATIDRLQTELLAQSGAAADLHALEAEIKAQHPDATRVVAAAGAAATDAPAALAVILEGTRPLEADARQRLQAWLTVRTGTPNVWVFESKPPEAENVTRGAGTAR